QTGRFGIMIANNTSSPPSMITGIPLIRDKPKPNGVNALITIMKAPMAKIKPAYHRGEPLWRAPQWPQTVAPDSRSFLQNGQVMFSFLRFLGSVRPLLRGGEGGNAAATAHPRCGRSGFPIDHHVPGAQTEFSQDARRYLQAAAPEQ